MGEAVERLMGEATEKMMGEATDLGLSLQKGWVWGYREAKGRQKRGWGVRM